MQFWCSAKPTAWTWEWQAIVGVWVFMIVLVAGVVAWNRVAARRAGTTVPPVHPLFPLGVLALWAGLDWPIGALGGYLTSVHMLQFLLIGLVAPPLLLRGVSPEAQAMAGAHPIMQRITAPVFALVAFNIAVLVTHLPFVADSLMPSEFGSMVIDLTWLATGLLFWWPIVMEHPVHRRFSPPVRMLYLVGGLMFSPVMFGLAGFLAYSESPLYGFYELAPPIPGISTRDDHQIAGVLMSMGGAIVAFIGMTVIFFRWSRTEE